MSIIIGIDHGYYAIKTAHCSFPAGLTSYGEHEPYTCQGLLEFGGCFFVCGSGRQPIQRDKTANDNYYLLTLAAIANEIRQRGLPPECSVRIAAGLPLTSFGRDKPKFKDYLLRSNQPVNYKFEGVEYSITIEEVAIFPQPGRGGFVRRPAGCTCRVLHRQRGTSGCDRADKNQPVAVGGRTVGAGQSP